MRWFAYFILAYVALGLQVGLAPYLEFQGAVPNLVLMCVIFIGVNAGREPALLACFGLGAFQDILTQQPLGLYAFSYGLVGMFVVSTQELVYREHPLTHFSLTFTSGLITTFVIYIHEWIHPPRATIQIGTQILPAIRISPMTLFTSVIYTAALAVLVLGALQKIRRLFKFDAARRRVRMR